jgi:hypothetical protein
MRHSGAVRTSGRLGARSPAPARPDTDLARCGEPEERRAEQAVDALVVAASTLVTAAGHDPDRVGCRAAGCGLAGTDHEDVCALAHRLALLTDAPLVHVVLPLSAALEAFHDGVTAAVHAVQRCRVTRHPEGRCRFSPVPGQDGCAAVLQAAHRLG